MKKSKSTAVYKINILTISSFHCINDKYTFSLRFGNCIFNYSIKAHLCFSAKKIVEMGNLKLWNESYLCIAMVIDVEEGVLGGRTPPLRPKIWLYPPPLENFRAGYPLETPSRGSRGSVGGKLTPPPKKSRQLLYFWSN